MVPLATTSVHMRLSWHARMFVLIVSQAAFSPGARGDIEHTVLLLYLRTLKETRAYQGWQEPACLAPRSWRKLQRKTGIGEQSLFLWEESLPTMIGGPNSSPLSLSAALTIECPS